MAKNEPLMNNETPTMKVTFNEPSSKLQINLSLLAESGIDKESEQALQVEL
jgi:hypothetical protein